MLKAAREVLLIYFHISTLLRALISGVPETFSQQYIKAFLSLSNVLRLEYIKVKVPFRILLRLECSSFRFLKELKPLERDSPARLEPRERYEWIDLGQYMTPYVSSNFL